MTKKNHFKVTVNKMWVFFMITDLPKHALTWAVVSKAMASYISIESLMNIESD